jgi:hypothetical protein
MHTKTELDVTADRRLRRISPDSFVGGAAAIAHAIGYPTAAWTRRQLREALGVDRRYDYRIHDRMTHLIDNLGTLSMSSLKRCLAVAGYWSMASIVPTLPAASALPAATQPSSGDFNELTDLAKTPQADCERCYYLYAFRLTFGTRLLGTARARTDALRSCHLRSTARGVDPCSIPSCARPSSYTLRWAHW